MATSPVPMPILPDPGGRPSRISPTDVSQFVRLEQCERYLRFRLAERDGQKFMRAYDVIPQRITPLLTQAGLDFEGRIEQQIRKVFKSVHFAEKDAVEVDRPDDNPGVIEEARRLAPGGVIILFQPRLQVEVDGWLIRGDVDLLRLERHPDGNLHAMILRHEEHDRGQGRAPPPGRLLSPHARPTLPGARPRLRSHRDRHHLPGRGRSTPRMRTGSRSSGWPPGSGSGWTTPCWRSSPTPTPTSRRPTTS